MACTIIFKKNAAMGVSKMSVCIEKSNFGASKEKKNNYLGITLEFY